MTPAPTLPLRQGDLVTLRVEDLAFGGPGVARHEGLVVMVQRALPGDLVRAMVDRVRKSYAEASALELLEPSPDRVKPPCGHFGSCGGCRWQDLRYEAQLAAKRRQVVESLRRIGGLEAPPVLDVLPSPDLTYYRNKMEFSFGAEPGGALTLGLHPLGSYQDVFDLEACHLQSPASNEIVAFVRDMCRHAGLRPYDVRTHQGFLRYLTIREAKFTGETMVNLVTAEGDSAPLAALAARAAERFPSIVSFLRSVNARKATVAVGDREEVLHGRAYITERLLGSTFEITASSFFQTNSRQAERLYASVLEAAEPRDDDRLLDLYSGTGTISILASPRVLEVRGVESQSDSVRNAERNARINGARNCFFVKADARKALAAIASDPKAPTLVVVNPPRAGLTGSVIRHMLRLRPRRIVYVSCNPTTLARDAALVCERDYTLDSVRPVDMFPHTFHVECVARFDHTPGSRLERRAGASPVEKGEPSTRGPLPEEGS